MTSPKRTSPITPAEEPRGKCVRFQGDVLIAELCDGRELTMPLKWFPKLDRAKQSQRDNWEIIGNGEGFHWPDLDEDLSVRGFLAGTRLDQ